VWLSYRQRRLYVKNSVRIIKKIFESLFSRPAGWMDGWKDERMYICWDKKFDWTFSALWSCRNTTISPWIHRIISLFKSINLTTSKHLSTDLQNVLDLRHLPRSPPWSSYRLLRCQHLSTPVDAVSIASVVDWRPLPPLQGPSGLMSRQVPTGNFRLTQRWRHRFPVPTPSF